MEIGAGAAAVWAMFTSQQGLRSWMEPSIEIDVSLGGKHRHVSGEEKQLVTGEILEFEPMKRFSFSWFEDGPDTDWINPIRMTFALEAIRGGTRVTFMIDGFEGIGNTDFERTYEAYQRGTERHQILKNLKEAVDFHKDGRA